jgi:hypothetical protein
MHLPAAFTLTARLIGFVFLLIVPSSYEFQTRKPLILAQIDKRFFQAHENKVKFKAMKQQANLNQFKPMQANVAKNGGGG